jgi:hypothetical protein
MKVRVERVAFHAAHACNLACESCAHYSNYGFAGLVEPAEIDRQLAPWSPRLAPDNCNITGGEPTLNPQLADIVRIARRHFPRPNVLRLISNGFFLERPPGLLGAMLETGCELAISEHSKAPDYQEKFRAIRAAADEWRARGVNVRIEPYLDAERWLRRYTGHGATMLPPQDGRPARSWAICRVRHCLYVHENALWKCPPLAFLPMLKAKFPELPAAWDPYLAYKPLAPGCTDAELAAFVERGPEAVCSMCPAAPRRYSKPSPLVRLRARTA